MITFPCDILYRGLRSWGRDLTCMHKSAWVTADCGWALALWQEGVRSTYGMNSLLAICTGLVWETTLNIKKITNTFYPWLLQNLYSLRINTNVHNTWIFMWIQLPQGLRWGHQWMGKICWGLRAKRFENYCLSDSPVVCVYDEQLVVSHPVVLGCLESLRLVFGDGTGFWDNKWFYDCINVHVLSWWE